MPLVLVENERTAGGRYDSWQDATGRLYHFPNVYRSLVQPGERFVYYRGVRRALGGRRPAPEYFGSGVIEAVWRDPSVPTESPKRSWKWFCSLIDYVQFDNPVSWKKSGETIEQIPRNLFGNGVRRIPDEAYALIIAGAMQAAGSNFSLQWTSHANIVARQPSVVNRIIRDTPLVRELKELYQNRCQICSEALVLPGGRRYSEGHHIRPVGNPHNGPDSPDNLLIVCPNHHVLCDYGAISLDCRALVVHPKHELRSEYIDYHNERIFLDL